MTTGIVDPWRVVEPLQKPERSPAAPEQGKINLAQIDFDRDIRVAQYYIIRSGHGSIEVRSVDLAQPPDALVRLAACIWQLQEVKAIEPAVGVGVSLRGRHWNKPNEGQPHAKLTTPEDYDPPATVYFVNQSFDHGMLRLIKALNAAQRRPGPAGADILTRWGVTPMMR